MNTKGKTSIKESKTKITTATLMRLAGMSAIVAGLCFIVIGMFYPLNVPSAVNATWVNVHIQCRSLLCNLHSVSELLHRKHLNRLRQDFVV